jgi:hypothetical protein
MIQIENDGNITYDCSKQFDNGQTPTGTIYSDRLFQWDSKKHDCLCKKHFGNESQYWSGREPKTIELFLRDYTNNQNLILCSIEELENHATGFPLWRFEYK